MANHMGTLKYYMIFRRITLLCVLKALTHGGIYGLTRRALTQFHLENVTSAEGMQNPPNY